MNGIRVIAVVGLGVLSACFDWSVREQDCVVDGACGSGESARSCPADCSATCGDGACTHDEAAVSCPSDCGAACGDGSCTHEETAESCPADCPLGCGDGSCSEGETAVGCPRDCGAACGDGACTHEETAESCPADCPASCGDGSCSEGETAAGCPRDCGAACGDGACTHEEGPASCPADCPALCGDGACTTGETASSCPGDCGVECVPPCDVGETCWTDGLCRCGSGAACTGGNECIDGACLPPSCGAADACTPGVRHTSTCGRCGSLVDVCQPDCTWDLGTCSGEGECDPGASTTTSTGCPAGQVRTLECGPSCSYVEVEGCAIPMPVTFEFPTAADGYLHLSAWYASVIEGTRSTSLFAATEMEMTLTPSGNYLASGCSLTAQVSLNGVHVGDFFVGWSSTATVTRTFSFPAISGPDYTVRYETPEGTPGCGAVAFEEGPTPHTVTLRP